MKVGASTVSAGAASAYSAPEMIHSHRSAPNAIASVTGMATMRMSSSERRITWVNSSVDRASDRENKGSSTQPSSGLIKSEMLASRDAMPYQPTSTRPAMTSSTMTSSRL